MNVKFVMKSANSLTKGEDTMKATGIIRRIDDLGRVVIPKEIRRTCNIREGDPLEIFLENDEIVFKKYNPNYRDELVAALRNAAEYYADYGDNMAIPDRLKGIAQELENFL